MQGMVKMAPEHVHRNALESFWPWHEDRCWISIVVAGKRIYYEWDLANQRPLSYGLHSLKEIQEWCGTLYGQVGYAAATSFWNDCNMKGFSCAKGFRSVKSILQFNRAGVNGETLCEMGLYAMYTQSEHMH